MLRRYSTSMIVALVCLSMAACGKNGTQAKVPGASSTEPGESLFKKHAPKLTPGNGKSADVIVDPIVVGDFRITHKDRQEVSPQRDGVITKILVKEDDVVKEGDLLATLDDRLANAELKIKDARLKAAKADYDSTLKMEAEAKIQFEGAKELYFIKRAISKEEYRKAELMNDKYHADSVSKGEAVNLAEAELNQAQVMAEMYLIKAKCPGRIKTIYKKPGEKIQGEKAPESLFLILGQDLRVEGMVDAQYLSRFKVGMEVVIEASMPREPTQTIKNHVLEVTGVAVAKDGKTLVSSSEDKDKAVRLSDLTSKREKRVIPHPAGVRAVACTPATAERNLCLTGASDGKGRIWDLEVADGQALELQNAHRGAITCVAFSPDGLTCATGGDDREIRLWNVADGKLLYQLPPGHKGALTALHFTPQAQLVSEGRDNAIRIWALETSKAALLATFDRRSGEVANLGVSPDGQRVLFDQGKALRMLSVPGGLTEAVLQNPSSGTGFSTFALFSPNGQLILTAGPSEGRLQLWQAPEAGNRAHEIFQLVPGERERSPATCAAFSPDGKLAVTGTRDGQVFVWDMPTKEEIEKRLTAKVVRVEPDLSSSKQVRVWAELVNPDKRLLPGSTVTLVAYPQ